MRKRIQLPMTMAAPGWLLILLLFSGKTMAGDTTRVLFIGNSFIYTHDVPGLVGGFAGAANEALSFSVHAPGGISVGDTAQGTQAHMNNPLVFDLIRNGGWDFVVLQDNQGRFVYNYGLFPASSKVIEGHLKIMDSVQLYNPCAKMLWFAGWAFKAGYPPYGNTGSEMIDRIFLNYHFLNNIAGEIIAPIGLAWKRAIVELPSLDLWGPDGAHQSYAGSYLTAAVIFTSIYRSNTANVSFPGTLDSLTAAKLRKIAFDVVMDSLQATNLSACTPPFVLNGGVFTSVPGYVSYSWYKNDSLMSAGNAQSFISSGPGRYHLVAEDSLGCKFRSAEIAIVAATSLDRPAADNSFAVFPNPFREHLVVQSDRVERKTIKIRNMFGTLVYEKLIFDKHVQINLGHLAPGLYILSVETDKGSASVRLIKADFSGGD